jgi:hypothetical protein
MSRDPYLDGQLDDEGPRRGEQIAALVTAALVLVPRVLRGGLEGLIRPGQRGPIGLCLLGLLFVLLRDPLSAGGSWIASNPGPVSAVAIGRIGWLLLGLAVLAECLYLFFLG